MLDVLLNWFRKDDDVVDVHEEDFPFETGECDVQSVLECCWGIGETEGHLIFVLELTGMPNEGRFSAILFCYVIFPIASEGIL